MKIRTVGGLRDAGDYYLATNPREERKMDLLTLCRKIAEAAKIAEMQLDEMDLMSANDRADIAEDGAQFLMFVDITLRKIVGEYDL